MSRQIELTTKKKFELLPDYVIDSSADNVTFYIDSNKENLKDVMTAVNEEGALDKITAYKDGEVDGVYTAYNVFSALSSTGIAYALTLSRKSDEDAIKSLSTQVSDLTKESATSSSTAKQNSDDITDLQMAVASLYEQSQTATTDKEADK